MCRAELKTNTQQQGAAGHTGGGGGSAVGHLWLDSGLKCSGWLKMEANVLNSQKSSPGSSLMTSLQGNQSCNMWESATGRIQTVAAVSSVSSVSCAASCGDWEHWSRSYRWLRSGRARCSSVGRTSEDVNLSQLISAVASLCASAWLDEWFWSGPEELEDPAHHRSIRKHLHPRGELLRHS